MSVTHDFGPDRRTRGVDYSIYSFEQLPSATRFYVAGRVRAGDGFIEAGDRVVITPPGCAVGRRCRVDRVAYEDGWWDAVLDLPHRPAAPGTP